MQGGTPGQDAGLHDGLRRAILRSELFRAYAQGLIAGALIVIGVVRKIFFDHSTFAFAPLMLFLLGVVVYELIVAVFLRRMLRTGRSIGPVLAAVSLILECSIPTVIILVIWLFGEEAAHEAVRAPAVMLYSVFIVLSTLGLRPWLAGLSGVACAAQLLGLVVAAELTTDEAGAPGRPPATVLYTYPIALLFVGLAAAFVAHRIRGHVEQEIVESREVERLQTEMSLASRIQQGLLPRSTPEIEGYRIAGWSRPAASTGGDFFDWQLLPDGRLAISLADVSGHGLGPALVTAFCRAYVRATLSESATAADTLTRVNGLLTADLPEDRFITFALAVVAPGSGEIDLVSAGHGPLVIYRADDAGVELRNADGVPLGVTPELAIDPPGAITLAPGDLIALMTDGFFEWAATGGERFGLERLAEVVAAAGPRTPEAFIEAVRAAVEAFANGAPQDDDLTIVVIKRTA